MPPQYSDRDRFQIALFSLRHKIHIRDGKSANEAFATAIAETSDQAVEGMLLRTPTAVDDWKKLKEDQAAFNKRERQPQ